MNKKTKLKVKETSATNRDFYNLFRPIAPSIDIIGKVAQVISAVTEAITIWHITQSELAGASKAVAITVSIFAMLFVVALLELGGRKFLQVLTRTLVWKRFQNAWYISLFVIVSFITIGMGVMSFRLSTNGIQHAFVSNVPVVATIDDGGFRNNYRTDVKDISARFDSELKLIKENHKEVMLTTDKKYDAQIAAAESKANQYQRKFNKGAKWAAGHITKYEKKASQLLTAKTNALAKLQDANTNSLKAWQKRKNKEIAEEKQTLKKSIAKAEATQTIVHESDLKDATFWGSLFSWLVGFSVILAFVCIITVEVYRRGSGIQVEYEEEDQDPSILEMFWNGLTMRFDGFFRSRAERFAKISNPTSSQRSIGFNYPRPTVGNKYDGLPNNEVE